MIIYNNKPYKKVESDFLDYYIEDKDIKVENDPLSIHWKGALIPLSLIMEAASFFRDMNKEHSGEAQTRLFYNHKLKEWKQWAFAQECQGLHTNEITDDPTVKEDRTQFGNGWVPMGTIHSHCDASAFQSGTDHKDEINQDGIHITLGKISSDLIDVHARFSCRGELYEAELHDWVVFKQDVKYPEPIRDEIKKLIVKCFVPTPYPEVWKSRVKKKTYAAPAAWKGYGGFNYGSQVTPYSGADAYDFSRFEKEDLEIQANVQSECDKIYDIIIGLNIEDAMAVCRNITIDGSDDALTKDQEDVARELGKIYRECRPMTLTEYYNTVKDATYYVITLLGKNSKKYKYDEVEDTITNEKGHVIIEDLSDILTTYDR